MSQSKSRRYRIQSNLLRFNRGRVCSSSKTLRSGRVKLLIRRSGSDEVEVLDCGRNKLTLQFRLNVARILARTSLHESMSAVSFPAGQGVSLPLISEGSLLPAYIQLGSGTTPTTAEDSGLDTPIEPIVYYPLKRVHVFETVSAYEESPIYVAHEFDIYEGSIHSDGVSTVQINELVLLASDQTTCLARKLISFPKHPDMSLTVRWELRT
jgi:hypothetical protein